MESFSSPRPSGKEEALCRLQEENRRLSREQERVSRADSQVVDQRGRHSGAGATRSQGWLSPYPCSAHSRQASCNK